MLTKLTRRQMLGHCAGIVTAAVLLPACERGDDDGELTTQLADTIRKEFARGDTVICDGYVLSRTERQLWRQRGLC